MKLVGRYDSPYVRRVGVSLQVLALPFEHLPLSPFSQATEFRSYAVIGRMPALVLDDGETLIDSAAILDHLDQIVGPSRALIPTTGSDRKNALRILASATAACDKAIAINYERRRPAEKVSVDWLSRCRWQLGAALGELEAFRLELSSHRTLRQIEITAACTYAYVRRVEPDIVSSGHYPGLERLSAACEARPQFAACPQ
jgi:glutathione S-transferase